MARSEQDTPASSKVVYDLSPGAVVIPHTISDVSLPARRRTRVSLRTSDKPSKRVENAVYSHVRALKSLRHEYVSTKQIADSLSLSISQVRTAIKSLERKGVKLIG